MNHTEVLKTVSNWASGGDLTALFICASDGKSIIASIDGNVATAIGMAEAILISLKNKLSEHINLSL